MKNKVKRILATAGTAVAFAGIGIGAWASQNQYHDSAKAEVKAGAEYKDEATFEKGSNIAFTLDVQVPYQKDIKSLVIYDKLEPVFTHNKTRIFDGKTDITDQGTNDLDKTTNTTNWTAKDPAKWYGRKLHVRIETTLKDNADLSKYLDKNTNQYNIPNVGNLKVDDETTPSNEVIVHTPNDKEPTAVKTVKDKDGKYGQSAKYQQGDEINYQVKYSVPKDGKELTNVEFSDDLEDVLSLGNVKVTDEKGNDITKDEGTLTKDADKESFSWQPSKTYLPSMAGKEYTVDISAKFKTDADLEKYLDKASEEYHIPNVAHFKYNNKDIPSNEVIVITPPPAKNKVTKSVKGLSGEFKEDKDNVEVGKDYTYKIVFEPGAGKELKDVEFTDKLEDALSLEKVIVQNEDGKDITDSEGTMKLDKDQGSFNWQPKDDVVKAMGGKKYTVLVTSKVKSDADLEKYLKNNTIEIPNTAHMKSNGEDTPSNTPIVTPKVDEPTAKKGIVKNPSDWASFFGKSNNNTATNASGEETNKNKEWSDAEKYVKKVEDKNTPGGYKYEKANSSVTDKQFNDAIKTLNTAKPINSDTNTGNSESIKVKDSTSTPIDSSDLKKLIDATTVENNEASRGDNLFYLLSFDIGNNSNMKSLVISDNLEDVLSLNNVVVIDEDGNNVTNEGNLELSQQDSSFTWTATDPGKFYGKKVYVAIASNIKQNADLSKYSGKSIPNVGHLIIDGKDTPTNEVNTKLNGNATPPNTNNSNGTGNTGVIPQTGHWLLKNPWAIVAIIVAVVAGVWTGIYKHNKKNA